MELEATSDNGGNTQPMFGSDNRLNVSSRADGRGYYNSRDESESYSLTFDDANCTTGDYVVYLKNTATDKKHMVIRSTGINSDTASSYTFLRVTGTPAGGAVSATPVLLNQAGVSNIATATASTVVESDVSPISGLSDSSVFDKLNVTAGGHEEFRFQDQIRIGAGQAIAIKARTASSASCFGVIFFYFE